MNRRELLKTLALAAGAPRSGAFMGTMRAHNAQAELMLCGRDEVFVLSLGPLEPPGYTKIWSWRAAGRPEIPAALQTALRTIDDCKPVYGGRRILISASSGAIALVERASGRSVFHAPVVNAHSIEILPGDRIAAAASVSASPGGNRVVIFDPASGREVASDELRSGHGLVWDEPRQVLWALGGDVLRAYDVGTPTGPARLTRTFEIALPDEGGHDLSAVPGSSRLFVSTEHRCWYFDRESRRIEPHDTLAEAAGVKGYSVHPHTGRVAYVQAEGQNWWAERVHFQRPAGTLRLPGARLYKGRWA